VNIDKSIIEKIRLDKTSNPLINDIPRKDNIRFFSWKFSYFSGKVRSYLRYKSNKCGFVIEEILATPEIITNILVVSTNMNTVPQIQLDDGRMIHDSSNIIETMERRYSDYSIMPSLEERPKQFLVSQLIEILADEWMLVPAYHWRWAYSSNNKKNQMMPRTSNMNHSEFNKLQWGEFLYPEGNLNEKKRAGEFLFNNIMYKAGPKRGLINLGVTDKTVKAWEDSLERLLDYLEKHFIEHTYILGGKPSLGDFALIGPLYAHIYLDPVPGYMLRTKYPYTTKWIERLHDRGGEPEYSKIYGYCKKNKRLISKDLQFFSDNGEWLENDMIPTTIIVIIEIFFKEFWPVLKSSLKILDQYIKDGYHDLRDPLPSKSFSMSEDQLYGGPLSHTFTLPVKKGGLLFRDEEIKEKRSVFPYQCWMIQRIGETLKCKKKDKIRNWLRTISNGEGIKLFEIKELSKDCKLIKKGGLIFVNNFEISKL